MSPEGDLFGAAAFPAAEPSCGPFQMFTCGTKAANLLAKVSDISPETPKPEILTLFREGLVLIDDCWTCVVDEEAKAAICGALTRAVNMLEPLNIKIPIPSECETVAFSTRSIGMAPIPSMMTEEDAIVATAEALVDAGVESSRAMAVARANSETIKGLVNPMSNNCVSTDFSLFGILEHDGEICFDSVNKRVTIKGKFKAFGETVFSYNETFGNGAQFCIPALNIGFYKISPCINVDLDNRFVQFCLKQKFCTWLGCTTVANTCLKFDY